MDNIINLSDYRKTDNAPEWTNDQIMNLYNAVMEWEKNKTTIELDIDKARVSFTETIISSLYDIGADPEDEILMNDMITISMLFEGSLTEYFTNKCNDTNGEENGIYEYITNIQKDIFGK
jgi:hypothetical protein